MNFQGLCVDVSTDYLLGNDTFKKPVDYSLMRLTHLTSEACEVIRSLEPIERYSLEMIVKSKYLKRLLLNLLDYTFTSENSLYERFDKMYQDDNERERLTKNLLKAGLKATGKYSFLKSDVISALEDILKEIQGFATVNEKINP